MKKLLNVCVGILLLASTGCKKIIDCPEHHPGAELDFCQIQQFSFDDSSRNVYDKMVFTYNLHGDPVTGIRKYYGTGYPNYSFRYDKYNRLSELIALYEINDLNNVEGWHKYFYNQYDQIVKDSFFTFPITVNGQPTTPRGDNSIITYEYDQQNRVSKATTYLEGKYSSQTYLYDEKGNLAGPKYDDKVNFRRTNKIWMFLDRDYSLNNPTTASYIYNDLGLPVKIVQSADSFGQFLRAGYNSLFYHQARIKYTCDIQNGY